MIVMKFGGASVADAASIERVAEIVRSRRERKPAVVVSAMGKTTRGLLDAAEASASGDAARTVRIVEELRARHAAEAAALVRADGGRLLAAITRQFEELSKLLQGLAILGEVPPRGLDKILAYGELLSSAILQGALAERGLPARLFDARALILTDERYGAATPIFEATEPLVAQALGPSLAAGEVPVLQGFIGSTRRGATTTLGFEGSDYSATLLAAALGAADVEIWKEVPGLMTADPEVCPRARTVRRCSFGEAAELTYFGAKVLHPKAIHPAASRGIPVHIYDSRRPEAPGTAIGGAPAPCKNPIKSISYKRPALLIRGEAAPAPPDPFARALDDLGRRGLDPLVTTRSGSRVAAVTPLPRSGDTRAADLLEELPARAGIAVEAGKALLTLVGEDLAGAPDLLERAARALAGIRIELVVQGASPIGVSLLVAETAFEPALLRLHDAFFSELDPAFFV
jgi:aspartate kinase